MNLGLLFLKVNTLGVITLSELDWITNNQSEFSRLDMALVIKIGRLMDSGDIEIDSRLPIQSFSIELYSYEYLPIR